MKIHKLQNKMVFRQSVQGKHELYGRLQLCGHCTGQPVLEGTNSYELEDVVGAKFYYPHAITDSN